MKQNVNDIYYILAIILGMRFLGVNLTFCMPPEHVNQTYFHKANEQEHFHTVVLQSFSILILILICLSSF